MSATSESTAILNSSAASPQARLKKGIFVLEGINALSTAYYFNYLFFYMEQHFGFGNRDNLMITVVYGFVYMCAAWSAGRMAQKRGYFTLLRLGIAGMMAAMVLGGLIPFAFGYSKTALVAEFVILFFWTISICMTWPMLQSLVGRHQSPEELPRTAGIYNIVWATASAVAYLTGGALYEWLGGEVLAFWLPATMHLLQLVLLVHYQKLDLPDVAPTVKTSGALEPLPALNPRPIAKARTFLLLAWIANPFAYVAIYGILPVIPQLSEQLGLSKASAGIVCSVWFWTRLIAFMWFWLWPGWHYRFRWLLAAFVAVIASFLVILLGGRIWTLVLAEIVFGLAVGLVYYSSLYYSLDAGASKGKQGGIHEAAIGFGMGLGPAAGVTALMISPSHPDAGTWSISGMLVLGLLLFLAVRMRERSV